MDCAPLIGEDDGALVTRYLDGDADAMAVLYLRHRPWLFTYALASFRGDRDRAADLVQDTWEAILTYRRLDGAGHFRGLLSKIAHSLVVNAARWRASRERAQAELERRSGQPVTGVEVCRYCERAATDAGLCRGHYARAQRGASEEEMRRPIRSYRRKA